MQFQRLSLTARSIRKMNEINCRKGSRCFRRRKIYHTEDVFNSNSEALSQAGGYSAYHNERSSSNPKQESDPVKCSVVSDDKEQIVVSLQNHNSVTNTCSADLGITGDSYLHTSSMVDRMCTNIGSKQDDKPITFSARETEPSLSYRTSKELHHPDTESSYKINLKLQNSKSITSLTSQDLSTDSDGGKKNIKTEIIPNAANCKQQDIPQDNSASLISSKESQINCVGCSNQEMMPKPVDPIVSQQNEHSVTHSAQDIARGQTDGLMSNESTINQEVLPSEDKEDHNVSPVSSGKDDTEVGAFKKPSDPEPSSGYLVHLVTGTV